MYVKGHHCALTALMRSTAANVPKDLPPASNGVQSQPAGVPIMHKAVTSGPCVGGAATDEPRAVAAPRLNVSAASAVLF